MRDLPTLSLTRPSLRPSLRVSRAARGRGPARPRTFATAAILACALAGIVVGASPRPASGADGGAGAESASGAGAGPSAARATRLARVVAAAVVETADLAAPAGYRVSGTITGPAGPVADAVVTACPTSMAPQKGISVECKGASTSSSGAYMVAGLAPGTYAIRAAPLAAAGSAAAAGYRGASGYVPSRAAAAPLAVTADTTGIDLSLPAGLAIAGKATGVGSGPAPDAFIEACAADVPAGVACTGAYATADGSFSIGGLGAGSYTVSVQAPRSSGLAGGYLGADALTPLRSAARSIAAGTTGLDVTLPQGRRLTGTVSLEGAGSAGANQVLVQACPDEACVLGPSGWTRDDGTFELLGLLPGAYTVSFSLPDTTTHASGFLGDGGYFPTRAAASRVAIAGTDVRGVDVVLPRAAARLTGIATGGGARLRAGVIVACGSGGTCLWTRTAPDGSYALPLPSAGPWTVGLRAPALFSAGLPGAYTAGILLPRDSSAMDGYLGDGGFTAPASDARAVVVGSPDRTKPTVASRKPAPGAAQASRTTRVVVRFSEAVSGVSARSFTLRDATTRRAIPATVAYDATKRTATLSPKAALAGGRRFLVTLAATIADYSGNHLSPTTWAFATKR